MRLLSSIVGVFATITIPKILRASLFGLYAKTYNLNVPEITRDYQNYCSFQDFFTREIDPNDRPVSPAKYVSPVDGTVVDFGFFSAELEIKIKSFPYLLKELLPDLYCDFINGFYLILYLSPSDYHRIHSPVKGNLLGWIGYRGGLKTVNPKQGERLPEVLVRNERVISLISDVDTKKIAVVKVGATNVGSISLTKAKIKSERSILPFKKYYPDNFSPINIAIDKAEELARFNLGSTVVLCFEKDMIKTCSLVKGQSIKMGQDLMLD